MSRSVLILPLIALVALAAGCAGRDEVVRAPGAVVVAPPGSTVTSSGAPVVSHGSDATAVPRVSAAPAVVAPTRMGLRAGTGRIDSIAAVPALDSSAGASTGAASGPQRVRLVMSDGSVQFFDTDAPNLSVGDRIEITREGYLRRLEP